MPTVVKKLAPNRGQPKYPNRIKEIRERQGVSQEKLAQLANTTQPTISRYESAKRRLTYSTLDKLGQALGCHWAEFYSPVPIPKDKREAELLQNFRLLSDDLKDAIERIASVKVPAQHHEAAD
jgi:transcriptional regulator with XRE-family HTH domain